jgi:hypothetical protein
MCNCTVIKRTENTSCNSVLFLYLVLLAPPALSLSPVSVSHAVWTFWDLICGALSPCPTMAVIHAVIVCNFITHSYNSISKGKLFLFILNRSLNTVLHPRMDTASFFSFYCLMPSVWCIYGGTRICVQFHYFISFKWRAKGPGDFWQEAGRDNSNLYNQNKMIKAVQKIDMIQNKPIHMWNGPYISLLICVSNIVVKGIHTKWHK